MRSCWEICPRCAGTGMGQDIGGDWQDGRCPDCRGYGTIRLRDQRGRFTTRQIDSRQEDQCRS